MEARKAAAEKGRRKLDEFRAKKQAIKVSASTAIISTKGQLHPGMKVTIETFRLAATTHSAVSMLVLYPDARCGSGQSSRPLGCT
jgi:pterin-4a-carbinolamine dehydratase